MPSTILKALASGALLLVSAPALGEPSPGEARFTNVDEPAAAPANADEQAPAPAKIAIRAPTPPPAEAVSRPLPSSDEPQRDTAGEAASQDASRRAKRPVSKRVLHGFRLGYMYIMNYDQPSGETDPSCTDCGQSLKRRYGLRSPNQFLIGYELTGRLIGHDWLNVLLVGNAMVAGLEQSKFLPSANFLIGFEFDEAFQIGVGPNVTPERDKPAHMIVAAGWTPEVGSFYVPVHAFFIPDVDHNHKLGMTVGVNF